MQDTFTLIEGFVFSSYRYSKQSVYRLITLTWSEHISRLGCFQISSENNKSLLHAFQVIYLLNKSVTSLYVQE